MTWWRRIAAVIAVLAWTASASAQTRFTIPDQASTLPATCNYGDLAVKTASTQGLYVCIAPNTWSSFPLGIPLDLTSATGNLAVSHLDSGTAASNTTFWRGDGIWATPAGAGNVSTSGTPAAGQGAVWASPTTLAGQAAAIPYSLAQGRLTTESGVPVSTSDRTAQSTIYWTPYHGNLVGLYTGSYWQMYAASEVSLSLSSLTSGKNYDVFLYDNSGTLTLELSAAWTNDTTRADAIALQDGIRVKSSAHTRRLVGTIRTTGTTTTEDSGGGASSTVGGKRFVFNENERVLRTLRVIDTTDTWNYATASFRVADGATAPANCVEYVTGDGSLMVDARLVASGFFASNTGQAVAAIGINSTTAASGLAGTMSNGAASGPAITQNAFYADTPGLGYNEACWIEKGGGGTTTWFGDVGTAGVQSGLEVRIGM